MFNDFCGISKEAVEQDQDKQALVSLLLKRIMESDNRTQLMDELFSGGVRFTPISECSKEIIMEQGNVEAFETLELSNKVQCEHCLMYVPSGHVFCGCGRAAFHTTPNIVIVEQRQRKIKQKIELLKTPAFVLIKGYDQRSTIQHQNS